jgi:hypothetical protein
VKKLLPLIGLIIIPILFTATFLGIGDKQKRAAKRYGEAVVDRAEAIAPGKKQRRSRLRIPLLSALVLGIFAVGAFMLRKVLRKKEDADWSFSEMHGENYGQTNVDAGADVSMVYLDDKGEGNVSTSDVAVSEPDGHDFSRLMGMRIVDVDGDAIGSVGGVYYEKLRGVPEWVALEDDDEDGRRLVPLEAATIEDEIRVAYPRDLVMDMPRVSDGMEIDEGEEMRLYEHYSLRRTPAGTESQREQVGGGLTLWSGIAAGTGEASTGGRRRRSLSEREAS